MVESKLFEAILKAEIGNGQVYTLSYNASDRLNYRGSGWSKEQGDNWSTLNQANISPSSKGMIKDVINELDPQEKQALNQFDPNPVDIAVETNTGNAQVTFPNGAKKTVNV